MDTTEITDTIQSRIHLIRGRKVMLDRDLAELYGVETKVLNQAVKRNIERFPDDFMYQLTRQEVTNLKSQIVTSTWGGRRTLPYAFTELGIAMLSSVLKSEQAIQVNIHIMRVFIHLRQMIRIHSQLQQRLDELEQKYDAQFQVVFEAIRRLMEPPEAPPKRRIGFH